MLRRGAVKRGLGREKEFHWRGKEVTRIEGFSDAVFAFAVTLLVVSLEVPETFTELSRTLRGFPAFGATFALLIVIWHGHYIFFRRYGLADVYTVTLNSALLFMVLFYIYPLKFLFALLLGPQPHAPAIQIPQVRTLMLIYSTGFMAVFLVLVLFYWHAWRRRADLGLEAREILDTRASIQYHLIFVGTALLSIGIAALAPGRRLAWAGWVYALIGPACAVNGMVMGRRRARLRRA